jgi:hypothetical protein
MIVPLIIGGAATIGLTVAALLSSGNKKITPTPVITALPATTGPWTTKGLAYGALLSQAEAQAVVDIGNRLNIDPSNISTVIFSESGWSPNVHLIHVSNKGQQPVYKVSYNINPVDPRTIGGGLIGFMRSTMKTYPISLDKLLTLDRIGQLAYVEEFYRRHLNSGTITPNASVRMLKMSTIYPKSARYADDDDRVLWSSVDPKTKRPYYSNIAADKNKDGITTIGEAMSKINKQFATGKSAKYVRP